MNGGWWYRVASVIGTLVLTAFVVALVNNATVLRLAGELPVVGRLPSDPPLGGELVFEMLTATVVIVVAMVPLYKPRPRRILDTISLTQKRVLLAMIALAAIGYFDYTYRLSRLTVLLATPLLLVLLPGWFVYIRRRPSADSRRAIVVGDDPGQIKRVVDEVDVPLFGYLCPTPVSTIEADGGIVATGRSLGRLGGLSRLDDVLVDNDIDTAFLAFKRPDREEFFGALDTCYEHGVAAKVNREHVDSVLTADSALETFVDVDIEPWDVQDYVVKRAFDVVFSVAGLVALTPLVAIIALAIKLDDGGSVVYRQKRTAVFGETFDVYKFRSMVEGAEEGTGPTISQEDTGGVDPRVTRVGRVIRPTHLDEIPQLWSVLRGDMSVVGPRPERPEIDEHIEFGLDSWRSRWFVKPGLTGLAQISDATGHDPEEKLRYDLKYIRQQTIWYDLKIVVRQLWDVGQDVLSVVLASGTGRD